MTNTRNIVVGTDFSPCSLNAIRFAADLCQEMSGRLIVVHAYRASGRALAIDRGAKKQLRANMSTALAEIRTKYPGLAISEVLRKGDAMDALLWAGEKYKSGFIVVGTQGLHESSEVFVGNTTGSLIKLGNTAVLAIPSNCRFKPFRHVLFAVKNPQVGSQNVIEPFLDLTAHFGSHVTLLYVTKDSMPDLSRFSNPYLINPHIHTLETLESDNIYTSVQAHLREHEAELLVVINRLRGFFEGLFAQNTSSAATFSAHLPILALHGSIRE